jgi:hypothetical protein
MADSKPVTPLQLDAVDVLMKRVASNFEKHGEENVPVLDITWEAVVPPETMVGLLGPYCDRTLFNRKGELLEPTEVFKRSTMPVPIEEDLVAQYACFVLSDNIEREFGEEPDEGEEAQPSQLCPITKLQYEPKLGGAVWLGGSIRIRPGDALEHWAFLEHQGRHAKLTIADSAIKVGNGKQQSLPLNGGGRAAPAEPPHRDEAGPQENGGESASAPAAGEPAKSNTQALKTDAEKLGEIGPKTRAEVEAAQSRRSRRAIDGRKGAH